MKPFHISIFFLLIINGLVGRQAIGQTFGQPFYCVNYATNTSGAAVQITFSLPQAWGTISSIAPSGPNELLVATAASINNTASPRTATISVRCAANSRCPGKVTVIYGATSACQNSSDVIVYKSYTQTNINAFSAFVFGLDGNSIPNPYQIISDGCADPGELLNLSVVPVVSTIPCTTASDIYTWRFTDASGNPLAGWLPMNERADKSEISLRVPSPFTQPCTVQVRVGTCAAANVVHAQLIIRPSASPNSIFLVSQANGGSNTSPLANNPNINPANGFPNATNDANKTWCLNADFGVTTNGQPTGPAAYYAGNEFTLQALPDESLSGVTYSWIVPPGFDLVSQTGNKAVIRAYGGTQGASGVIQVNALQANTCRGQFSRLTIQRRLVPTTGTATAANLPFNTPTIGYPSLTLPGGGTISTPAPCNPAQTLLEVKQDYTLTLPNVPANTPVTWSCTNNTSNQLYWEFRPVSSNAPTSTNPTVYATNIVTTTPSVIGRYRIPVVANTAALPGNTPSITYSALTCGPPLTFSPGVKLPNGVRLRLAFAGTNSTGNGFITVQQDLNSSTYPPLPCNTTSLRHRWSFQGTFSAGPNSPYNNADYEGLDIFQGGNNSLAIANPQLPGGVYTGTFRVAISNGGGVTGCTNCFAQEASISVNNFTIAYPRPGHGGGTGDVQDVLPTIPQLYLKPNPAVGTGTAGKEMFKK